MGLRNDYRVSTIIVLCKDCGQDVGLYPARHQCTNVKRPYLPTLCSTTSDNHWLADDVPDLVDSTPSSTTVTRQASDSSMESGKWNFFRSNSVAVKKSNNMSDDEMDSSPSYFDNYATHLKTSSSFNDINDASSATSGKKLWGRMKENEKWKELVAENQKKEENKTSGKLWERIIHATMSNSLEEQYHDSGPESDDEDWEGETHVSRILREYHQSVNNTLPKWLYDDRTPITTIASIPVMEQKSELEGLYRSKTTRQNGRRLWQASEDGSTSARERERQALRANGSNTITRTQSERIAPSLSSGRTQRSNLRNNYNNEQDDNLYGSIAPRRTNTTRAPPVKHYLNNNIPSSGTTARSKNYF